MTTSKRDTLITALRSAYGLEGQALSTMENVHARLKNYPEFKAVVGQHIKETRDQQKKVEQCLGRFGETPSTIKEAAMKLMGNLQAMLHAPADDEVLKNLFALYAFERFEIASYRSLITMAEECVETDIARICRQILQQEETAGQKLEQLLEPVTQAYLQRKAAGGTASR